MVKAAKMQKAKPQQLAKARSSAPTEEAESRLNKPHPAQGEKPWRLLQNQKKISDKLAACVCDELDYKNPELLKQFLTERGKIPRTDDRHVCQVPA